MTFLLSFAGLSPQHSQHDPLNQDMYPLGFKTQNKQNPTPRTHLREHHCLTHHPHPLPGASLFLQRAPSPAVLSPRSLWASHQYRSKYQLQGALDLREEHYGKMRYVPTRPYPYLHAVCPPLNLLNLRIYSSRKKVPPLPPGESTLLYKMPLYCTKKETSQLIHFPNAQLPCEWGI